MSRSLKFLCVSGLGLLTALLVAAANALVAYLTGFNVFSLNFWVVVPAGAFAVGIAATSGYYLGCLFLQLRPGVALFAQMIVVAAAANLLIYYFEYLTAVLKERPDLATSVDGFSRYLSFYLSHQEMSVGTPSMSLGGIGQVGYAFAAIDFVGFLAGGFAGILFLQRAPTCTTCSMFYRRVARKERRFANRHDARNYYDGLFSLPPDGPEFAAKSALGARSGNFTVTTTLLQCPQCKGQLWQDEAAESEQGRWRKLDELKRSAVIPPGLDLAPLLRGKAPASQP